MSNFSHSPHPIVAVPAENLGPVLGVAASFQAGHDIPPHRHDRAQLVYAATGVMTVTTDQGTWVVPPQRAVWVPALVGHSIKMTGRVEMKTVYIEARYQPEKLLGCCVIHVSPLLSALVHKIVEFEKSYGEGSKELRLVRVFLDEAQTSAVMAMHLPAPVDSRLRDLTNRLGADPSDNRSLEEWAKTLGASARTLARVFRRDTGLTFGQWRQQLRLLCALELLAAGTSVTEVALELGYDSTSAFVAMFRKNLGRTPGRYFAAI